MSKDMSQFVEPTDNEFPTRDSVVEEMLAEMAVSDQVKTLRQLINAAITEMKDFTRQNHCCAVVNTEEYTHAIVCYVVNDLLSKGWIVHHPSTSPDVMIISTDRMYIDRLLKLIV